MDLASARFDVVLADVLRSKTEMERIQGLDKQEFQGVIDVLGQVKSLPIQFSWFPFTDALFAST